jgi:hypothetical protein
VKPHKVRYCLERRDAEFELAQVLCIYREVEVLKKAAARSEKPSKAAIVSYDEKPGIQAVATTAPDLPPAHTRGRCTATLPPWKPILPLVVPQRWPTRSPPRLWRALVGCFAPQDPSSTLRAGAGEISH